MTDQQSDIGLPQEASFAIGLTGFRPANPALERPVKVLLRGNSMFSYAADAA